MILFALWLFATSILSGGYGQSYGAAALTPIDFNDEFNNRHLMIKPNENFVYSFEQIRKDQPPQVEQRNENIGRYMYRKPKTTTDMPNLSSFDNLPRMEPLPRVSTPIVPVDIYNNQWNHVSAFPSTIPPPPSTPKWADLSEILNKQHFPHYNTPTQSTSSFHPNQPHYPSVLPANYQPHVPVPVPDLSTQPLPNFTQANNRQSGQLSSRPIQEHIIHPKPPQLSTNRGSHKFSWNDITTTTTTTYAPHQVAVSHQNRNPPASFPTLSPWADGFRK